MNAARFQFIPTDAVGPGVPAPFDQFKFLVVDLGDAATRPPAGLVSPSGTLPVAIMAGCMEERAAGMLMASLNGMEALNAINEAALASAAGNTPH